MELKWSPPWVRTRETKRERPSAPSQAVKVKKTILNPIILIRAKEE